MTNVNIDIQTIESHEVKELYIAATPSGAAPIEVMIREAFKGVSDVLKANRANILQERIFASSEMMECVRDARKAAYGEFDDGVSPTLLVCQDGAAGSFAGIQVHAVASGTPVKVVYDQGMGVGRLIDTPNGQFVTLSEIAQPELNNPDEQAMGMLHKAKRILRSLGADFKTVARTWMWLNDILSWYDTFNRIRNVFFAEQGILSNRSENRTPASTGVGLAPANGTSCAMDLVAILKPPDSIDYIHTSDKQQSAFEYGSAFSRATRVPSPASQVVYISGTAAIDAKGATTYLNNPDGQIKDTIDNVKAVMRQMDCLENQVLQAVAYCKDMTIEQAFNQVRHELPWPWITIICDICRDDLLFEIEAVVESSPRH